MKKTPSEAGRSLYSCTISLLTKLLLPVFLVLLFLLCARFIPGKITYEYKAADKNAAQTVNNGSVPESTLYIIRAQDGKIAVFEASGAFVKTVDINVSELPEYDRRLLVEGIVAEKEELSELIESLLS